MSQKTRVFFLPVNNNREKKELLCQKIREEFLKKKQILILTPQKAASLFMDDLLWKCPEHSFLPHSLDSEATKEPIVITNQLAEGHKASVLFNLAPVIDPLSNTFDTVYELLDKTDLEKEKNARSKWGLYRHQGCSVEECTL